MRMNANEDKEIIMSHHSKRQWHRRGEELLQWVARDKKRKQAKVTTLFGNIQRGSAIVSSIDIPSAEGYCD